MLHAVRWAGAAWAALAVALPALADPPAEGPAGPRGAIEELEETLAVYLKAPEAGGHDDKIHEAWNLNVKRRARSMVHRLKSMGKDNWWIEDEEDAGDRPYLKPTQWTAAVKHLASLYTELGAAAKGWSKVKATPRYAYHLWDRRNPRPDTTGLTPAGSARAHIESQIAWYRVRGRVPPSWLAAELLRLGLLEAEEIRAREELLRSWEESRRLARAEILASVERTNALLKDQVAQFEAQMGRVREIAADMQVTEEERLRVVTSEFPADDAIHEQADALFAAMEKGRAKALRYHGSPTSGWGTRVRQGWTSQRAKLLSAIRSAERRRSDAGGD